MTASRIDLVARRLGDWPDTDATDRDLLAAFRDRRDEAAFTLLLRRHGPMVWRVCSRLLSHPQDAEGRYELLGCPKTNVLGIFATPPGDTLCLPGSIGANDPGGLGPMTVDLTLSRGIAFHGKALDGDGKPVPGTVSYYALHPNPLAQAQTEGYSPVTVKVKDDGSFTCPVLPGPGAVLFSTPRRDFAAAHVDARAFFQGVNDEARMHNGEDQLIGELGAGRGGPQILYQESYQSIVLLHPAKDEKLQPVTLPWKKRRRSL